MISRRVVAALLGHTGLVHVRAPVPRAMSPGQCHVVAARRAADCITGVGRPTRIWASRACSASIVAARARQAAARRRALAQAGRICFASVAATRARRELGVRRVRGAWRRRLRLW